MRFVKRLSLPTHETEGVGTPSPTTWMLTHRQGGAHAIWINSMNAKIASVPRHREIKENTARAICKQLEVPLP